MSHIKKVHVIFKTHLDIGFTDLAQHVLNKYCKFFIPEAIQLAEQLRQMGGAAQFIWTTGAWLIHEYLKQATEEEKRNMENAIASGSITWHGLPFTTHTELMDPLLFEYGLSIAGQLNVRYGKSTLTGKMTDVPGHTRGMVSLLEKWGIRYLHIGVNPASKVPSVPEIFVWKGKDSSEVIVNYASNYGNAVEIEGFEEVMVFAHTGDNCGPPTIEAIQAEFAQLSEKYPGAVIQASTMDAFAEKLIGWRDRFPVIHEEIGDTWIHGAASDPTKITHYRELLRLRDKWLQEGKLHVDSKEFADFCDQLILIPEHTWGMDEKKFLTDFKNYSVRDFHAARQADLITELAILDKYRYIGSFAMDERDSRSAELFKASGGNKSFRFFESSWQEQREYVTRAIRSLSEDKQREAMEALRALTPVREEGQSETELQLCKPYSLGLFQAAFNQDGAICHLADQEGKVWADEDHCLGRFQYETFGIQHYQNWFQTYVTDWSKHYHWADADFGKPGMEFAEPTPVHKLFSPNLIRITTQKEVHYDYVQVQLEMPLNSVQFHGAPRELRVDYKFYTKQQQIDVELNWFDKQAFRLPEASWFSFALKVENPNLWKMDKMGDMISPLEVVKHGNRSLHAVHTGVYYDGSDGKVSIETWDAPLVSPGEKRVLQFNQSFASLDGGMHFNLHNNVWGTNFPMWYEEDAKFRFTIHVNRL